MNLEELPFYKEETEMRDAINAQWKVDEVVEQVGELEEEAHHVLGRLTDMVDHHVGLPRNDEELEGDGGSRDIRGSFEKIHSHLHIIDGALDEMINQIERMESKALREE